MTLGTVATLVLGLAACADRGYGFDEATGGGTGAGEAEPDPEPPPAPPPEEDPPEEPPEEPEEPPLDPGCENGEVEPGEWCHEPQVEREAGYDPCAIAVGDIDGDGHADAAVPNSDFGHVVFEGNVATVLYGDGTGALEGINYTAGGEVPVGIALGDFDGDDRLDVVVSSVYDNEVAVLLNRGNRGFSTPIQLGVGAGPSRIATGDFDRNGFDDIAVNADSDAEVDVLLSTGGGAGAYQAHGVGLGLNDIAVGDFDRDGVFDLATTNSSAYDVSLLYGRGGGGFDPASSMSVDSSPITIDVGDLDGDGWLDLAIGASLPSTLVVMLGGPDGFVIGSELELSTSPYELEVADLDGDKRLDVAFVSQSVQQLVLLRGDGFGRFEEVGTRDTGPRPSGVAAADFNEDGVLDLAVSNQDASSVGVFLSNP